MKTLLGGTCVVSICSYKLRANDWELDRTSNTTFGRMCAHTVSVLNQMCYTTAGKSGHAMNNGRISKGYGGAWSTLSMNMSSLLLMKIM